MQGRPGHLVSCTHPTHGCAAANTQPGTTSRPPRHAPPRPHPHCSCQRQRSPRGGGDAAPVGIVAKDGALGQGGADDALGHRVGCRVIRGSQHLALNQHGGALAIPGNRLGQALCGTGRWVAAVGGLLWESVERVVGRWWVLRWASDRLSTSPHAYSGLPPTHTHTCSRAVSAASSF